MNAIAPCIYDILTIPFSLFENENYFSWVKHYHAEENKKENLLAGTSTMNKYLIALSQFQVQ